MHADVWGPSSVPTHGGNRYFLSIIDGYSTKVWVMLMKNKSDVFDRFKTWKNLIERQTGMTVKTLRTYNGLEFCNENMNQFFEFNCIRRHKTVPYTPQQNGIAERINRTLLERIRSMITPTGLSKRLWGEAVMTATHLINRSP